MGITSSMDFGILHRVFSYQEIGLMSKKTFEGHMLSDLTVREGEKLRIFKFKVRQSGSDLALPEVDLITYEIKCFGTSSDISMLTT